MIRTDAALAIALTSRCVRVGDAPSRAMYVRRMRRCLVVLLCLGCSESKNEQAAAPPSAPSAPPQETKRAAPAVTPPAAAPVAPNANAANAANEADLTLTGEWERTLKGTGVRCTIREGQRNIDKYIEIKVDTRDLQLGEPYVAVTLKRALDKPEPTIVQVDVQLDKASPGRPKYSLYGLGKKGASITTAKIADDASSAEIDATLGYSKNDGKTVRLAGTVKCGNVRKSKW